MKSKRIFNKAVILFFGLLPGVLVTAQAHPVHEAQGLSVFSALVHPFAVDHFLVMLAVGLWSVMALAGSGRTPVNIRQIMTGPMIFLLALLLGLTVSLLGFALPALETSLSLSVIVLGLMLLPVMQHLPKGCGLFVISVIGVCHGMAHGVEAQLAMNIATYALGLIIGSAALHIGGMFVGLFLKRWLVAAYSQMMALLAVIMSYLGFGLLFQLA